MEGVEPFLVADHHVDRREHSPNDFLQPVEIHALTSFSTVWFCGKPGAGPSSWMSVVNSVTVCCQRCPSEAETHV